MNRGSNFIKSDISPNNNRGLTRDSLGIVESTKTIIDIPLDRLNYIKEISHKLIFSGTNKDKIIIPPNVLEEIHQSTGIKIHDYIQDPKFKALVIKTLNLESNYGFVRYDYSSAIILVKINDNNEESEKNETIGLTEKNIDFILSNILKIGDAKSRMNIVYNIINKINLEDLAHEYLSSFFDYGNYMQFVLEIIKKHILILSNKNIDLDICNLISGFIVKEFSELDLKNRSLSFEQLRAKVLIPKDKHQAIPIHITKLGISSHNMAISNVINPLFKESLKESLNPEKNYGLIYDKETSEILMLNVACKKEGPKMYNGLNESRIKEILVKNLKLEHKEDIRLFLSDLISNIDLNKLSQNKLASIFESGKYLDFVLNIMTKEVFALAKGTIDKEVSKGVTGYLFREHFDFINSHVGKLLLDKLSYSTGIKPYNIYKVDKDLEAKVNTAVYTLKNLFNKNMKALVNDIDVSSFRKAFKDDIFIDFSEAMKIYFKNIGINNPDRVILKGMFIELVNRGCINNPMINFTETIFEEIGKNNDKLEILFGFFHVDAIQIIGENNFPSFSFRDIEISSSEYSVKRVFDELNKKITNYPIKSEMDRIIEDFANTLFHGFIR